MTYSSRSLVCIVALCSLLIGVINGDDKTPSNNSPPVVIAPHCSDKCGDVTIPYPFGIEPGCYYSNHPIHSSFHIHCNHTKNPPTPSFGTTYYVSNISLEDGEVRTGSNVSFDCYNQSRWMDNRYQWFSLRTFTLSRSKNMFVAMGCDTRSKFSGFRGGKQYVTGCITKCVDPGDVVDRDCSGVGCCQVSIPDGINNVTFNVHSNQNHSTVSSFNPCSAAFPIAKDAFIFYRANLSHEWKFYHNLLVPMVLSWTITGQGSCSAAKANRSLLCGQNAKCYEPPHEVGYRCKCEPGFFGNPYLPLGCQDVDECNQVNNCEKAGYCENTIGSYNCKCPKGYHGNGTKTERCVSNLKPWVIPVFATVGVCSSVIVCLIIAFYMHWQQEKKKLIKSRERFFSMNGGHLLQQKLSGRDVSVGNTVEMFTNEELKKATNDFSQDSVIGRGGFGMVYKGSLTRKATTTLPESQVVAIKKSLKVDSTQVEPFINEIIALSQINNKNVVKLLGCCLETEMPLLVYEFISNGTLSEHLHDERKAQCLTWDIRLRIAVEVSEVLAYLHSTISIPIIHRDIKSANILLDESYTAKVADFGASKLTPTDHEQLASAVKGTMGYLDPEYMQTAEATNKSDVYSFGVVLVELLTRKKVISFNRLEHDRCLPSYFLRMLNDDRLFEVLDKNLLNSGETTEQQLTMVSQIAKKCLDVKREDRPTMKEIARDLDGIKSKVTQHPWLNNEGLRLKEECGNLLGETPVINKDCGNDDSFSTQTSSTHLTPANDFIN